MAATIFGDELQHADHDTCSTIQLLSRRAHTCTRISSCVPALEEHALLQELCGKASHALPPHNNVAFGCTEDLQVQENVTDTQVQYTTLPYTSLLTIASARSEMRCRWAVLSLPCELSAVELCCTRQRVDCGVKSAERTPLHLENLSMVTTHNSPGELHQQRACRQVAH